MFIPGDEVANTPQSWSSSTQRLFRETVKVCSCQNSSVVMGKSHTTIISTSVVHEYMCTTLSTCVQHVCMCVYMYMYVQHVCMYVYSMWVCIQLCSSAKQWSRRSFCPPIPLVCHIMSCWHHNLHLNRKVGVNVCMGTRKKFKGGCVQVSVQG